MAFFVGTGSCSEAPFGGCELERPVPLAAGRIGGSAKRASNSARCPAGAASKAARPRFENSGLATFSGRRSGSRRRTEVASAPAAARQPLGRRRHPGAHDGHLVPVVVGLVGVDDARIAAQPCGLKSPGWPVASSAWPKMPCPSSSKPPSTALTRSIRADRRHRPAAARAQLVDVPHELVDGRPVPVRDTPQQRSGCQAPHGLPCGETGERGRVRVAVALRTHALLPDRDRARQPRCERVRVGVEDCDLLRCQTAVTQGRVGYEAGEAASNDRIAQAWKACSRVHDGPLVRRGRRGP